MKLAFHQLTSQGDREINQDCMVNRVEDDFALFVVADGLGGHYAGEKASRYFCQGLLQNADTFVALMDDKPATVMALWIDAAVDTMRFLFAGDPEAQTAHTTCAILYLDRRRAMTAHCGDSRVYRLNAEGLLWRTPDHSVPQRLLDGGLISESEMAGHPEQNRLLRSINAAQGHTSEINVYPSAQAGETFVLCSDGFWGNVKSQEFLQLAQPDSGLNELAKIAKLSLLRANGKSDNITVQWVRIG